MIKLIVGKKGTGKTKILLDMDRLTLLDSTLRDGAQGPGISFSVSDKLNILRLLDELGIPYIEAGNPFSNPKDREFFQEAAKCRLSQAKLTAFGATRRPGAAAEEDPGLRALLDAQTEAVTIFGKASAFQVEQVLRTDRAENLAMIAVMAGRPTRIMRSPSCIQRKKPGRGG